ncbi:MAG: helix-turn-helix domain-containing protein [Aminipila sp.]
MSIGENIKNARKSKGLSQSELGAALSVSQAMIAQYENGVRNPKFETIKKIAEKLDVPLGLFLEGVWDIYMEDVKTDFSLDNGAFNRGLEELLKSYGYYIDYDEQRELLLVSHGSKSAYITEDEYDALIESVISYFAFLLKEKTDI